MPKRTNWPRTIILSIVCTAIVLGVIKMSWLLDARNKSKVLDKHWQTDHFDIHTDMDDSEADEYVLFFEGFRSYFEENFFSVESKKPLEVYLFKDEDSYRPYVQALYGNYTPYGFYTGLRENRIVINGDSGLGTITHEMVHYFIDVGFETEPPKWVDEGIATFFEKFMGHFDENGKLHISFGYFSNWRFPIAKGMANTIDLSDFIASTDPEQCCLRSFSLFLHKKGLFTKCVKEWKEATQKGDWINIVEDAYGLTLDQIELQWKSWIESQPIDGDVELVESAFVLQDWQWQQWLKANQDTIYWSEQEGIYRVRAK